jgi:hypothetical protein
VSLELSSSTHTHESAVGRLDAMKANPSPSAVDVWALSQALDKSRYMTSTASSSRNFKPTRFFAARSLELPDMLPEQMIAFESMAISSKVDEKSWKDKVSLWDIWYHTPSCVREGSRGEGS